ncbi:MAG: hypothetical protein NTW21_20865 [Verrucomicrobia bacterium]|nr:hypothetical protein [Verrucomicrobiota bacterium]
MSIERLRYPALSGMVCAVTSAPRKPFWLLPNLLSLDAPLVAVVWLYLFAKTWGVNYHPGHEYVVLGLAVWVLYVGDRLLDTALHGDSPQWQARHHFHRRHRRKFLYGIVIAGIAALTMVLLKSPMAIYSYLIVELALVAGFFAMAVFASPGVAEIPFAKNILGGAAFAFGTAMVAHVYLYDRGIRDLLLSREFIGFALLCMLNISAIDLWEHAERSPDPEVKAADELALTLPLALLGTAAFFFAWQVQEPWQTSQQSSRPFFYAILTGAALLLMLNQTRARFSLESLRVLADLALVAPALVFFSFPGT